MKAKLFCTTGILAGRKYEFTQQAVIGSSRACAIVIDAPGIAPRHARIFYDQTSGCYVIEEGRVHIATRVDGVPINHRAKLGALHVLTFARQFDFVFQILAAAQPNSPAAAQAEASVAEKKLWTASPIRKKILKQRTRVRMMNGKTLIEDVLKAQSAVKPQKAAAMTLIEAMGAPQEEQRRRASLQLEALRAGKPLGTFVLKEGENLVGRSPECEVFIDDPSISRRHASLIVAANGVRVRDLGSRNHTYLDTATVVSETEIPLESRLRFGMVEAVISSQ